MSISYWLDQSGRSKKNYDFVIVGGGIAGLSTAYWLQKEDPKLKIALIEKARIGFGASGRNAGFVTCGSTEHFMKLNKKHGLPKATQIWKFSETNRELIKEHILGERPDDVDYKQTGSCTVAPSDADWTEYQKIALIMREQGIDVREVTGELIEGAYGVRGFKGGIEYAGDGHVHPLKLLEKIRSQLKMDIFEGTEVFDIQKSGDVQKVKTDKGLFEAPKLLLTLNAYLPMVLQEYSKLLLPQRGQILMTEPLPKFVRGPCYLTKYLCYFRQLPAGNLLIGGFRNHSLQTENTSLDQTTTVIQDALLKFVRENFTQGAQAKVAYQWSGIMGFTPDDQMMIGKSHANDGIFLMAGCAGHGMGLSFHAAKVLVGSAFGKPVPDYLDIQRFKLDGPN